MNGILDDRVNWRKDKIGFNSPVAEYLSKELKEWTLGAIESWDDDYALFNKEELKKDFYIKIINNKKWDDALNFWKKIHTIKLIKTYQERKKNV